MLTLRNNLRITFLTGLVLIVIACTATAARNDKAAQGQAKNREIVAQRQVKAAAAAEQRRTAAANRQAQNLSAQQPRIQKPQQAAPKSRVNAWQIPRVNQQARIQRSIAPATRTVRVEKPQQPISVRRGQNKIQPQQQKQQQRTVKPAVKVQPVRQTKVTTVKRGFKATPQKPTITPSVKQAPRQSTRKVSVVQPKERSRQIPQKREERTTAKAESQRGVDRQVNHNVDIKRTVTPRGTKVTTNRDSQRTVTRNGNTFTRNIDSTIVRQFPNRYSRPRASRSHHGQKGKSARLYSHIVGRRPGRIFNRVVWPKYVYPIYYSYGRSHYIHYVRPNYHRKYIFFSIGSYWPAYYTSVRYYWYGSHVYRWYGCYPTVYSVGGDTYNYYTYNTYNDTAAPLTTVDHTTFEDVRQKLSEQNQQQPDAETLADKFFEDGVNAFEKQNYDAAAAAFADAIALDPDDRILPFAYVQALFASEQYSKAADILRLALEQMPADQQGLFFPRGLYAEDEILYEQIEDLHTRAETFSYDPDLPLLLGYQLIGVEQHEDARKWLEQAAQYDLNENATNILTELLDKLQEQTEQASQSL